MSDQNNVRIDVVGDAGGFRGAADDAAKELDKLKESAQVAGGKLGELGKSVLPSVVDELASVSGVSQEVISSVAAMGVGFVAAGAAALVLNRAMMEGHDEMVAMNRAIAASGGFAGQTRSDMESLAASVAEVGTITVAQSKKIVTELVSSGRIAGAAIGEIAGLAENYAAVTGQAVESIGPKLVSLFKEPAKGAAELNQSMHFLTAAQLEYIQTLEDAGRHGEAQLELSNRLKDALPEHARELTTLGTVWANLKKSASEAWDAMLGIGKEATLKDQLDKAKKAAEEGDSWWNRTFNPDWRGKLAVAQAGYDKEQADADTKAKAAERERAEQQGNALLDQYSKTAKKLALAKKMASAEALLPDGQGKNEVLAALRDQIIALDKEPKIKAAKKDNSFFKEWERSARDAAAAELHLMQQHDKAEAMLASYARQDKLSEERIARSNELAQMSEREWVAATAVYKAQDESARRQEQIIKQISDETERTRALAAEKDQLAGHIDRVREASLKAYDESRTFEAGWSRTFQRYQDEAGNAAKRAEDYFSKATDGMADALTQFAMTGKLNFSSLANSIISDMIRMQMRAAMAPVTNSMGNWLSGLFGGGNVGAGQIVANTPTTYSAPIAAPSVSMFPLQHSGGIVGSGEGSGYRALPGGVFSGVSRYHTGGIAGDEVPTILQKGEGVFTEGQMKALGASMSSKPTVNVVVRNEFASAQPEVVSANVNNNGNIDVEMIVRQVMSRDVGSNGPITRGFAGKFGLRGAV